MAKYRTEYPKEVEYEIRRKIEYDKDSGKLFWKEIKPERLGDSYYNTRYAGKECGRVDGNTGYVLLCVHYLYFRAHRLIWFLENGEWPRGEIDHINHIRHDNRLENLRVASRSDQMRNRLLNSNNTSGVNGVRWHKTYNKWYVDIWDSEGNKKYLGKFENFDDAVKCRKDAEKEHGYSETHGSTMETYDG